MVVIVETNKDGKIELTKEELESIIEEAKEEGRREQLWWVSPTITTPQYPYITTNKGVIEITC